MRKLYFGGKILTMDLENPVVSAVLTENGNILAAGDPENMDTPVTPLDMLHSIWCAVNRRSRTGRCVGADNKISVPDALMAATVGGAYTYGEEGTKGILKPGAVTDFVILDRDPLTAEVETLRDIRVLYRAEQAESIF